MLSKLRSIIKNRCKQDKNNIKSLMVQKGVKRNLYQTRFNDLFWLAEEHYLDKGIIDKGIWENYSTEIVRKLVKPGFTVLDVGANIGYYSVILSKLVGEKGKVLSFEPTQNFRKILLENLSANKLNNCKIFDVGLSDKEAELVIDIGEDTASLHWSGNAKVLKKETIKLKVLDEIINDLNLDRLDFIKIDVDGHEPAFLKGAMKTIRKFKPMILLEISHLHYLKNGITAWDFYEFLKNEGVYIYFEEDLMECKTLDDFLIRCGNFAYSSNVVITYTKL